MSSTLSSVGERVLIRIFGDSSECSVAVGPRTNRKFLGTIAHHNEQSSQLLSAAVQTKGSLQFSTITPPSFQEAGPVASLRSF